MAGSIKSREPVFCLFFNFGPGISVFFALKQEILYRFYDRLVLFLLNIKGSIGQNWEKRHFGSETLENTKRKSGVPEVRMPRRQKRLRHPCFSAQTDKPLAGSGRD